ncbi:MAG: response regulator [Bdellovibrionales bacterium]|nr:response regulator [Bdellovibrionales bacterium]
MKSLLILEDDTVFRERLNLALTDRGFNCRAVESVAQGVEIARTVQFDYGVLDLRLTDGSGLEVLDALRFASPKARVVVLTGFGTISTAVEAIKRGAVHYLTKPTHADAIVKAFAGQSTTSIEPALPTLAQVEWNHIQSVVEKCSGNISKAAKELGLHRRSLQRKLSKNPGPLK